MRGCWSRLEKNSDHALGDLLVSESWAMMNCQGGRNRFLVVIGVEVGKICFYSPESFARVGAEEWIK